LSQARITEILENEIVEGWTSVLITAPAGTLTQTVKSTAGKVAYLKVNGAYGVTLKDNTTAKWEEINNTYIDFSNCPIQFSTSIKLTFGGAGSAWIIYK
jgi:predicted methyltransferase